MTKVEAQTHLRKLWEAMMARLSMGDNPVTPIKEKDFFELVDEARLEWQAAISHFNHVSDPDLVDHAIHSMEAAERKYTFLLKKARQEGYRLPANLDALRGGE